MQVPKQTGLTGKMGKTESVHNAIQFRARLFMVGYNMSRHLVTKRTDSCCTKGRKGRNKETMRVGITPRT